MGQKIHPIGFRIGISEPWRSRWYATKKDFSTLLVEEQMIRRYIKTNFADAGIAKVEVERTGEIIRIILNTARPGIVIGRKGAEVDRMRDELQSLTAKEVKIEIIEITKPEVNAQLVAEGICEQLEKRASFRRAMKKAAELAVEQGAKGVKINLGGRLGGAEMARREKLVEGGMPLQNLMARIDYGFAEAKTAYGRIGCKVWIYLGAEQQETSHGVNAEKSKVPKKSTR
jgi:small subunit ribosomal protein S3